MAMTNTKIEHIYTLADAAFKGGQQFFRVHILPFKMTNEAMARHSDHRWIDFWQNLKTGYQMLEDNKMPPNITVKDKTYHFKKED